MTLNANTIRNRAHEAGLFGRVARDKPLVNKVNQGKRLKLARDMLKKPIGFWKTVIWSDESKGPRPIRSYICYPPISHFQYDRKIEHEILHISVSLLYFLLNAKKIFKE